MKNIMIIAILALFLTACGSNKKDSNARLRGLDVSDNAKIALADKDSEEKVICTQQRRMGSNRITTVCRSASEIAAERKATQFQLRETRTKTGPAGEGSGGR